MYQFTEPKKSYEDEANQAIKLIKLKGLIMWAPLVFLIVLAVAISIVAKSPYPMIIAIVGIIYFFVIKYILENKFNKLNKIVVQKYLADCSIGEHAEIADIQQDNMDIRIKMFARVHKSGVVEDTNLVFMWKDDKNFYFASKHPTLIENTSFNSVTVDGYRYILGRDFGVMSLSLDCIDHYRNSELVCTFADERILRIVFANNNALEHFIPQKEYYYSSKKKNEVV